MLIPLKAYLQSHVGGQTDRFAIVFGMRISFEAMALLKAYVVCGVGPSSSKPNKAMPQLFTHPTHLELPNTRQYTGC